jgi:hypothetical protein
MNREIKFRIVDLRYNEVLDGKWFLIDRFGNPYDDVGGYEEPDRFKPIFYTGLKDRFGKEIYEGDIVKSYGRVSPVKWVNGLYSCEVTVDYSTAPGELPLYGSNADKVEVIGNIYENKGLIE